MVRKFNKVEKAIASQWFVRVKGIEKPGLNITDLAIFTLNGKASLTKDSKSSSYCVNYLDGSAEPTYIQNQDNTDAYSNFRQAVRFLINTQVAGIR